MSTQKSLAEAKAEQDRADALKKRAARQAASAAAAPQAVPKVECTVLPLGDGKISMGEHIGGLGEVHYEENETFQCPVPTAEAYKARGWVNFKAPKAEVPAA